MMKDHCFEFVEGHGEEFSQVVGGEDTGVELALPHDAQVLGSSHIFFGCDHLEVTCPVVHDVAIDVVDLHARCARPDPGLVDEGVTGTVTELSHVRISIPPFAVMAVPSRRTFAGTERVLDLADGAPCDGEEASVGGAVELCLAVIGFGVGASSYFDALENKRVLHNTSLSLLHAATCGQLGKAVQSSHIKKRPAILRVIMAIGGSERQSNGNRRQYHAAIDGNERQLPFVPCVSKISFFIWEFSVPFLDSMVDSGSVYIFDLDVA